MKPSRRAREASTAGAQVSTIERTTRVEVIEQSGKDDGFDPDSGWRSAAVERQYAHAAIDLLRRLRPELGADVALSLDMWPLATPSLVRWTEHRVAGTPCT